MEIHNRLLLRQISEKDLPFLRLLYGSTREEEMALVDWTEKQKKDFLDMQFTAQHHHYKQNFNNASFDIIELAGEAVGRLYLDRRDDEIRIVDIALFPAHRGKGIGSHYLDKIMSEAKRKKIAVRIHVENFNPALRFYQNLGFRQTDTNGVYHLLEWFSG